MDKGLTRPEILKKLPNFKPGNFDLYMAKAGLKKIGMRATKRRPHIMEYVYPLNSVQKIQEVIDKSK